MAVVEGATPERVEQATADLAAALRADQEHFAAVDHPAGEPFFARHGLLYLDPDELADLGDRLAAAQPLLATLAADPSLRGLAAFVELAQAEGDASGALPEELDRLLGQMAEAVAAQLAGRPGEVSWRQALQQGEPSTPIRGLVVAEPRFDQQSLALARPAIEALRAHARDQGIDAAHGLELRLTGEATLNQEELQSVRAGATLAAAADHGRGDRPPDLGPGLAAPDRGDPDHARARPDRHRRLRRARDRPSQPDLGDLRGAVRRPRGRLRHPPGAALPRGARRARRARRGACAARSPGSAVRCR